MSLHNDLITERMPDNFMARLDRLERIVRGLMNAEVEVSKLSLISNDLGEIEHGFLAFGEGDIEDPESAADPFTGVGMGFPGWTLQGTTWGFIGFNTGVLQFGASVDNGKLIGGAGNVTIDEDGITIVGGSTATSAVTWVNAVGAQIQELRSNVIGTLTQGTLTVTRRTEGDKSALLLLADSASGVSGDAVGLLLFSDGTTKEASLRLYPTGNSTDASMIIGGDGTDTPAEALEVRGNITTTGFVEVAELEPPSTPASGKGRYFVTEAGAPAMIDDSGAAWGMGGVHYPRTTINNTTTKTPIYTDSISANALGNNGIINIQIPFIYMNNTGGNRTITFTVEFGSTSLFATATNNLGTAGNQRTGILTVRIANAGATNAQQAYIGWDISGAAAAGNTAANDGGDGKAGSNAGAEDTTAAKTLTISVTHSNNDTTMETLGALVSGPYNIA